MRKLRSVLPALALTISACDRSPAPPEEWLGPVTVVTAPAVSGSRYPHLAAAPGGGALMSWLQAVPDRAFALQHARWMDGRWSEPGTVATGEDWFINWADFPSVVPLVGDQWAAHWLQQKPGSVYSYDVRIALSDDGGASWSAPMSPHDDGTPTEHGFVTLFAAQGHTRAVWLDGRHTSGGHDHESGSAGAMTLRTATLGADGRREGDDRELDARVCDCCQTDAALTDRGAVVVYRDRGPDEIRDIALVRLEGGQWREPVTVHADGWKIAGCPVNGPAVDARGDTVVVAWFTAADGPRVRLAFSLDGGHSFEPPLEVASGDLPGRVDVELLDDGRAVVSWMQQAPAGAEIRVQPFTSDGAAGEAVLVAATSVHRSSGFPQMVRAGDGLLFAWTDAGDLPQVRTAFARLH